jgi:uncharacterized LabA/DUF88 family protein
MNETSRKKACVYIDGFNLFYGILKGSKYKWLNLEELCKFYFPKYDIVKIKYFTALVKERKNNKKSPINQQIYLRALQTLTSTQIIYGTFLEKEFIARVEEKDKRGKIQKARVWVNKLIAKLLPLKDVNYFLVSKYEEKGSDVNLGIQLVNDAHKNKFDVAVVISNDSDLAGGLRIVKNELKKQVEILNPYPKTNKKLQKASSNIKYILKEKLFNFQFSNNLVDKVGNFHKPKSW